MQWEQKHGAPSEPVSILYMIYYKHVAPPELVLFSLCSPERATYISPACKGRE